MNHYRQHVIVLLGALLECLLLGLLGLALKLRFGQTFFLILLVLALLLALRSIFAWMIFSIQLRGRHLAIRSLRGLVITEQPLALSGMAGLHTQQNVSGYLLDYGNIQLDTFDEQVKLLYVARFSALRRQLARLERP